MAAAAALRHAETCGDCLRAIEAARLLSDAFDDEIERAEAEISATVDALLADILPRRWPRVAPQDPRFLHDVVISALLRRGDETRATNPRLSADYAATAAAIARKMYARGETPVERVIEAVRDHSTSLRAAGHPGEAFALLQQCEQLTADAGNPEYELAVLDLAKSMIMAEDEVGMFDDAIALAGRAATVFEGADPRRAAVSRYIRASARSRAATTDSDRADVLAEFRGVKLRMQRHGSATDVAACDHGIGRCLLLMGLPDDAIEALTAARATFAVVGATTEVARCDWFIALAHFDRGDAVLAASLLATVATTFFELGMPDEWVSVRLSYIEARLAVDPAEDILLACQTIAEMSVALDVREPTRRHRCTADALAYLRQAAARRTLTREW